LRVKFSDDALADLESIGDEIAQHNPVRAATYLEEMIDAIETLGEQPERCPLMPQFGINVRRFLFGEYGIYYRVQDTRVQVSRILHGRRRMVKTMIR
jgi:toxin ParE1/3/4